MNRFVSILFISLLLLAGTHSYAQEYAKSVVKKSKGVAASPKKEEKPKQTIQKPQLVKEAPVPAEDDEFLKLMKLAASYNNKRKYTDAVATYNKALEFKRQTGWVLRCRGSVYFAQKDYVAAIKDYTAAIEAKSDYLGEVYYSRAMSKVKMEVPDKAGACADFSMAKELGFTVTGFNVELYCADN